MTLDIFTLTLSGIFGLIIGSYLNVVIYRVPRRMSVLSPRRSMCPNCETQLSAMENIPVLSWMILGGKCRHCKEKISGQYPLVELLTGLAGVASYAYYGLTPTGLVVFAFTATLIALTFIDQEHKIIPDRISLPGMVFGFIIAIIVELCPGVFTYPITPSAFDSLIGFVVGMGFFYVIALAYLHLAKKEGLGGGDIKLMGFVGALLGWQSIAPTIFVGSFFGAIFGVIYMLVSRQGRNAEIPFGPWLALGALLYVFADLPYFRF